MKLSTSLAAAALWIAACASDDGNDSMMNGALSGSGATGGSGGSGAIGGSGGSGGMIATGGSSGSSGTGGASGTTGGQNAAGAGGSAGAIAGAGGMMAEAGAGGGDAGAGGMAGAGGGGGAAGSVDGPDISDPCTASISSMMASGSGPHEVVIETNSDPGIDEGTIYRPADLGGAERYPIFIWGEGGCARQGLSNRSANAELASHGYFVIADGTPSGGGGNRSLGGPDAGAPMIKYIDWAIAENHKPCSAYYHSLDPTKVATNGFSCGGLMAQGTASDPRVTTWMINSSGGFGANQALYDATHGPVLIVLGGPSDIAYENGKRDYDNLAELTYPVMLFSKDIGHGGDLFAPNGGDFTKLNLAWINWWLKGDETITGKGFLVGDGCTLCEDSSWETASANVP
jgi:dienelactone hydrolase